MTEDRPTQPMRQAPPGRRLIGVLKRRLPGRGGGGVGSSFRRSLQDRHEPLSFDMDSDSRTLLIALGGQDSKVGMPPFEFFSATGEIPCKRLFVRDVNQAWYQMGLAGYGTNFVSVADTLRELISGQDVGRLVLAGASGGGYAALAFGTLLGADLVLCFAPQTTIDLVKLHAIDDHRYDRRIGEITDAGVVDPEWSDLNGPLAGARIADTRYHVFFADSHAQDRLHAERLLGLPGLRLYRFGRGGHNIARVMRETGALEKVLERALVADGRGAERE